MWIKSTGMWITIKLVDTLKQLNNILGRIGEVLIALKSKKWPNSR